MNIYKKLALARVKLQNLEVRKSGKNNFAGYSYMELGDFLPYVNLIFEEVGLCGVISFTPELAILTIHSTDDDTDAKIIITSPMAEANLKGCHPIQNLGAVETYQRRYLWLSAMEIVEHDALDASNGSEENEPKKKRLSEPKPEKPKEKTLADYKKELQDCKTEDALSKAWIVIPPVIKKQLVAVKDEKKVKLTKQAGAQS